MKASTYAGAGRRPRSLACNPHATLPASLSGLTYVLEMGELNES
jgi:hypothetical protein